MYVDGFNLYYGLRAAKLDKYRWLDVGQLANRIASPQGQLEFVRYFTSRIRGKPASEARQGDYLDALQTRGGIAIEEGHFLAKEMRCNRCGHSWKKHEEKKTDVNIAVRLLEDAHSDAFDVAIVVSGDSDLAPAIRSVRKFFPQKQVLAGFPPRRQAAELKSAASATFRIANSKIKSSLLPDPVQVHGGAAISAPPGWTPT